MSACWFVLIDVLALLATDLVVRECFAQFEAVMHACYLADGRVGSWPRSVDQTIFYAEVSVVRSNLKYRISCKVSSRSAK